MCRGGAHTKEEGESVDQCTRHKRHDSLSCDPRVRSENWAHSPPRRQRWLDNPNSDPHWAIFGCGFPLAHRGPLRKEGRLTVNFPSLGWRLPEKALGTYRGCRNASPLGSIILVLPSIGSACWVARVEIAGSAERRQLQKGKVEWQK